MLERLLIFNYKQKLKYTSQVFFRKLCWRGHLIFYILEMVIKNEVSEKISKSAATNQ